MSNLITQLLFGLGTGALAFGLSMLAGRLVDRARSREKTVTFMLHTRSGNVIDEITIPKNPTPEEEQMALEDIRRIGEKAQRLRHA